MSLSSGEPFQDVVRTTAERREIILRAQCHGELALACFSVVTLYQFPHSADI